MSPGQRERRRHAGPRRSARGRWTRLRRPIHDLRISVMDRCNFRCPYCMPREKFHEKYHFLKTTERLDFDEILRLARIFVRAGVAKLRITGGEPLLRPNLADLIGDLTQVPGIEDIALTTNGVLLAQYATELKAAGLKRITVSLDSLDPDVFTKMSGGFGGVADVLDGIEHARRAGLAPIKINAVVQRGVNDHTALDLVERFRGTGVIVRFIEYMDVGTRNDWNPALVVPSKELAARIHERWPIAPRDANYRGEVAERYAFEDGDGEIGFISSVTQPFCGDCSRARLSSDGVVLHLSVRDRRARTCALAARRRQRRRAVRAHPRIWSARSDRYSELRASMRDAGGPAQDRDVLHRRVGRLECLRCRSPPASPISTPPTGPTMVDVGAKAATQREAIAEARVKLPPAVARALARAGHRTKKGPVFDTAIVAGVMAAKRTHELIPFCHPLALERCNVEIEAAPAARSSSSAASPCITRPASRWRRSRARPSPRSRSTTCARRCRTTSRSARAAAREDRRQARLRAAGRARQAPKNAHERRAALRARARGRPQHAHAAGQGRPRIPARQRSSMRDGAARAAVERAFVSVRAGPDARSDARRATRRSWIAATSGPDRRHHGRAGGASRVAWLVLACDLPFLDAGTLTR